MGLQTNNTLFLVNKIFIKVEQNKLYKIKFIAKKRSNLQLICPLNLIVVLFNLF